MQIIGIRPYIAVGVGKDAVAAALCGGLKLLWVSGTGRKISWRSSGRKENQTRIQLDLIKINWNLCLSLTASPLWHWCCVQFAALFVIHLFMWWTLQLREGWWSDLAGAEGLAAAPCQQGEPLDQRQCTQAAKALGTLYKLSEYNDCCFTSVLQISRVSFVVATLTWTHGEGF